MVCLLRQLADNCGLLPSSATGQATKGKAQERKAERDARLTVPQFRPSCRRVAANLRQVEPSHGLTGTQSWLLMYPGADSGDSVCRAVLAVRALPDAAHLSVVAISLLLSPADVPGQGRISAAPTTDRHTPLPQHSQDKLTTHVCSETGKQTLHVLNRSLCRNYVFHRTQSFFTLINPNSKVLQGKVRSPFSSEWKAKTYHSILKQELQTNLSSAQFK